MKLVVRDFYTDAMKGLKTGGRKLGSRNINPIRSDIRNLLSELMSEHLEADLMKLDPSKRAELMVKFLPYLLPQCQADEVYESTEPLVIITQAPCTKCGEDL
jgi:hypothetical protein